MKNWFAQFTCASWFVVALLALPSAAQTPQENSAQLPAQCSGALMRQPQPQSRKASVELFKDVIKTMWDNEGLEHNLGKTMATVTSLTLGKSYRWKPMPNAMAFGTKPKTVYPIKVKYTTCTEHETDWRVAETQEDELYDCYVDEKFAAWICMIHQIAAVKHTAYAKPENE